MSSVVRVTHYSDLLCVWAYVSQVRVDELQRHFGDQVAVDVRFCEVFGDTPTRVGEGWAKRGGYEAYAAHVREVIERFDHCAVHGDTWTVARPKSSMPVHLFLCAVRELGAAQEDGTLVQRVAWALRCAFFAEGRDIGRQEVRMEIAEACEVDPAAVRALVRDGTAHARLAGDLRDARSQKVSVSPTLVFNEGRQMLAGNVGYRIIEANVSELIERPDVGKSWC